MHNAHLAVAACLEAVRLDRVFFVPAAQSPLKATRPNVSDNLVRTQATTLASLPLRSPFELQKGGVSYSIETALHFGETFLKRTCFGLLVAISLSFLTSSIGSRLARVVSSMVVARPSFKLK